MRAEPYFHKLKRPFQPALAFGLALTCLAAWEVSAQTTNSWTNTVSGNWTAATNWTPGAPASAPTNILQFLASAGVSYTATNNFASPFILNRLVLNSTSSNLITLAGNSLQFTQNVAVAPQLLQNGSGAFLISNAIVLATNITFTGTGTGAVTIAGIISGNQNFTKSGNYTLTLNGVNTFGGTGRTITLNGGTLAVSANSRLGSTLNAISIATNATLQINGSFNNAPTITLGTRGGRVEVTGANVLTQSGLLTGNNGFTKNGTGILVLQATSARNSTTTNNAGILQLDNSAALGTGAIRLNGGTFAYNDLDLLGNSFTLAGGTLGGTLGTLGGPRLFTGNVSVVSNSFISLQDARDATTNVDLTLSGVLSGSSNLSVLAGAQPGALTLSNRLNTFSGTLNVGSNVTVIALHTNGTPLASATLALAGGSAVSLQYGTTNGGNTNFNFLVTNKVIVTGDASLDVRRPIGTVGLSNLITFSTLSNNNSRLTTSGANNYNIKFNGPATLEGGATFNVTSANVSLDGAVGDGASPGSLTKSGNGTLFLTNLNNNTYTGGTRVNAGTLLAWGGSNAVAATFVTSPLGPGDLTLAGGTLDLRSDTNQIFGSVAGYNVSVIGNAALNVARITTNGGNGNVLELGALSLGAVTFNASGNNTDDYILKFNGGVTLSGNAVITNTAPLILVGAITDNGGGYSLAKTGADRLFLTNLDNHTYSGGTSLANGQLRVAATSGTADNQVLGTGPLTLTGGTLELRAPNITQKFGQGLGYDVTVAANATIDVRTLTAGNNGVIQLGTLTNNGVQLTVSNANTFSLLIAGDTVIKNTSTFSVVATGGLQLNSLQEGTPGAILRKTGSERLLYNNIAPPAFTGGTLIEHGQVAWRPNVPGEYQFGPGTITLDGGGSFAFQNNLTAGYVFSNQIIVNAAIGRGSVASNGGGVLDFTAQGTGSPRVTNAGSILLRGPLTIVAGTAGDYGTNNFVATFTGPITLSGGDRRLVVNSSGGGTGDRIVFNNPFLQDGSPRTLTIIANNSAGAELGGDNSGFTGGFRIAPSFAGRTGRVLFANTNALPGGLVNVESHAFAGLGFSLASLGVANLFSKFNFAPDSILGLTVNNTQDIDLSPAGFNRDIRLGVPEGFSINNTGVITPFGAVYKFGGGNGTLTLTATDALRDNGPTNRSLDVHPNPFASPIAAVPAGTLILASSNSFTGGTVLNAGTLNITAGRTNTPLGTGRVDTYALLIASGSGGSFADAAGNGNNNVIVSHPGSEVRLDNGSASNPNRFGDAAPLALNGAIFRLIGRGSVNSNTTEQVGDISFAGGSQLTISGSTSSGATATLTANSLTRTGSGTLQFNHSTGTGLEFGNANQFLVTIAPAVSNGMTDPWFVNATDNTFLDYGVNGFANITYSSTSLATAGATDTVNNSGLVTLATDRTVYALRSSSPISAGASSNLTIVSGGFILSTNATNAGLNLSFGAAGTGEALLFVANNSTARFTNTTFKANGITKFGDGILQIQSGSSYSNGWSINRGALSLGGAAINGLGTTNPNNLVYLNGSAALLFAVASNNITYTGGRIVNTDVNTIGLEFGGNNNDRVQSYSSGIDMNSVSNGPLGSVLTLRTTNSRTAFNFQGPVTLNADATFNVTNVTFLSGGSNRVSFVGGLAGTNRSLLKIGNGTLGLRANSSGTFANSVINVRAGTLSVGHNGALGGASSVANIASNAVLEIGFTVTNFASTAILNLAPGSAERWLHPLARFADAVSSQTYTVPANVNLQLAANLTGLTGKTIRLTGGSLEAYTFLDDTRPNGILVDNNVTIELAADSKIGQSGVDLGRTGIFTNNAAITESGGSRSLTKIGLDTVILGNNSSYSGDTFINEGTLRIGVEEALPFSTRLSVSNLATFDLNNFNQSVSGLSGNGMVTNTGASFRNLNVFSGSDTSFSGTIGGNINLLKQGGAALTLSGASSFTGSAQIFDGTLVVAANAMGTKTPLGSSFALITGAGALLAANGITVPQAITIDASLSGTKTIGAATSGAATFTGAVSLQDATTLTAPAGGRADFHGVIDDAGSTAVVTKAGAGTVNLTAANTYSGGTTVNDGTLLVNNTSGSATGSGGVNVFAGATLGGSGRVAGPVTVFEGTVKPGNSAGSLRFDSNFSLQSLANLAFEIGGLIPTNEFDVVSVGGTVDFAGTLQLSLLNSFLPPTNTTWALMNFAARTATFDNAFNATRLTTTDNLGSFKVNYSTTNLFVSEFRYKDNDADGIADAWALKYFGQTPLPNGTGPDDRFGDKDGDGQSNYAEYVAGTDPLDEHSVFKMTEAQVMGTSSFAMRFTYVSGKTYGIQFSSDLVSWQQVNAPSLTFPEAGQAEWIDDGTQTGGTPPLDLPAPRFYRVLVQ